MGTAMLDYCRFKDINAFFANGQPEKARRLLMEIQSRCIALRDEVDMLKLRLETAEEALYLAAHLFEDNGFYWLDSPNSRQGPFCPRCYKSEGALIRLERSREGLGCPYCNEIYKLQDPDCKTADTRSGHARILRFAK